jgi:hypothetical protein
VLLGVLVGLAALESIGALVSPRLAATAADWTAAEKLVRAGYQPGDLILFAPRWIDPIGRLHLGDLLSVEAAARAGDDRFGRLWTVSFGGARTPETLGRTRVAWHDGRLAVGLYTAAPPEVSYDFLANLASASLEGGGEVPRVQLAEVDFSPRRCIAFPPAQVPRTLTFPGVKLGRTLVGYTGLDHFHQRKLGSGLVELSVHIGGQSKLSVVHANDSGWRRFEVDTSGSNGMVRDVKFVVSAPDPRHRMFCLVAEARI